MENGFFFLCLCTVAPVQPPGSACAHFPNAESTLQLNAGLQHASAQHQDSDLEQKRHSLTTKVSRSPSFAFSTEPSDTSCKFYHL